MGVIYDPIKDFRPKQGTVAFTDANGDIDIEALFAGRSHEDVIKYVFGNFQFTATTGPHPLTRKRRGT